MTDDSTKSPAGPVIRKKDKKYKKVDDDDTSAFRSLVGSGMSQVSGQGLVCTRNEDSQDTVLTPRARFSDVLTPEGWECCDKSGPWRYS